MPRNVDDHRVQRGLTEFVVSNEGLERRQWEKRLYAAIGRLRAFSAKPLNERGQTLFTGLMLEKLRFQDLKVICLQSGTF